jgi:hypothetical protein
MKTMKSTSEKKKDQPMVIPWLDLMGGDGAMKPSYRCGAHGGKGRKTRQEENRKAIQDAM